MKKNIFITILICCLSHMAGAQSKIVLDFTPACDSLAVLLSDRCGVKGELKLKAVMKRKNSLDFYFTETLGDYPWYKSDPKWFRQTLKTLFPEEYGKYKVGEIYSRKVALDDLIMPGLGNDGTPGHNQHRKRHIGHKEIVRSIGDMTFDKGLEGKHIALWQSHGRYYDQTEEKWSWQRPCLFQTCEDMFTQGFVIPYLVPMLENAGAYILMPRERDIQKNEIIADNDTTAGGRGQASYEEYGKWSDAGIGFADTRPIYTDTENPFRMGTARQALCVAPRAEATASVKWTPVIPERGEYAVYISYTSLPESTTAAHYTVSHMGGTSEFAVNQKMGGGTWIYLGTFEFAEGEDNFVALDNSTPEGNILEVGAKVTADGVRFGGGMGNIARSRWIAPDDSVSFAQTPTTSGLPRSAEAARYWLQWAGADTTVYYQNEGKNDYKDDFMSRGDWVEWISRGSVTNPSAEGGLGIPIDLAFGFHTDAGTTPNDSIVGTLAIYSYRSEGKTTLPAGEDRLTSRMFADIVQNQVVHDLRCSFDSLWTRRSIWDRAYRESRTPSSPAMLLELLSHQNFADMKYALDPSFKFAVSRAIYKGMLKYMSNRYGTAYAVQPLPVDHVGVEFEAGSKVAVSWKKVVDPLEPTAEPTGYIVYKRIGQGAYDSGTFVKDPGVDSGGHIRWWTEIPLGEVVSFKVAAYNEGGVSFPSETVSIGIPHNGQTDTTILIVNNFDRISGPAYYESGDRAGFDNMLDSGVQYVRDITFVGEMYNFRRNDQWISNERPGFGASYSDKAGEIVAGNTFDYASVHGRAILEAGHAFRSCSNERFIRNQYIRKDAWAIDLICGKQVTTKIGNSLKYSVFSLEMQSTLTEFAADGGNILVSGAYIWTDLEDSIYPVSHDSLTCCRNRAFAKEILGYRFITNQAGRRGKVAPVDGGSCKGIWGVYRNGMNPYSYCVESPDGIAPSDSNGHVICRYEDSGISAGVAYQGKGYKAVSIGFPIEIMTEEAMTDTIIRTVLEYFKQ